MGIMRCRGWVAVQVLSGALLPFASAPAQRPWVVRPGVLGVPGPLPTQPPGRTTHRLNASWRRAQEGPALEEGWWAMWKFSGERYSRREVICTESGMGHRAGPGAAKALGTCSDCSASNASAASSPRSSMAPKVLSTRAHGVPGCI